MSEFWELWGDDLDAFGTTEFPASCHATLPGSLFITLLARSGKLGFRLTAAPGNNGPNFGSGNKADFQQILTGIFHQFPSFSINSPIIFPLFSHFWLRDVPGQASPCPVFYALSRVRVTAPSALPQVSWSTAPSGAAGQRRQTCDEVINW